MTSDLATSPHLGLPLPPGVSVTGTDVALVRGDYHYYHYGCDGLDDRGWGCGYRTLQTMCSWIQLQRSGSDPPRVPTLPEIQRSLVQMEDKSEVFVDSREWIGSVEVGLIVDSLYDVPCKLLHISSGNKLKEHLSELERHFREKGAPIMMGGDGDAASKGIIGVCQSDEASYLLILDPHYYGPTPDQAILVDKHMLLWRPIDSFMENSFYNLCLPQFKCNT